MSHSPGVLAGTLWRRRRPGLIGGVVALLLLSTAWGLIEWGRAETRAARDRGFLRLAVAREWLEKYPTMAGLVLVRMKHPEEIPGAVQTMLEALGHPPTVLRYRGPYPFSSASLSPDGQRLLAVLSHQGLVQICNADGSGETIKLSMRRGGGVASAEFDPTGQRVVTATNDGTIRVWKADGSGTSVVLGEQIGISRAAFSPDGRLILTASNDGAVRVWNAEGGGPPVVLQVATRFEDRIDLAEFGPDSQRVLTTSSDRKVGISKVAIWKADGSGRPVVLEGHSGRVLGARFKPGRRAGRDRLGGPYGSSLERRRFRSAVVLAGHFDKVLAPSSARAAGGWSPGRRTARPECGTPPARGTPSSCRPRRPALSAPSSPDGRRVVTGSADGTARIWDAAGVEDPVVLAGHSDRVWRARFSPDGRRVLTVAWGFTARVWDVVDLTEPSCWQDRPHR